VKLSRRNFLRGTVGAVAVTVFPIPREELNAYITPEQADDYRRKVIERTEAHLARVRWTKAWWPERKCFVLSGDILVASPEPDLMHSMMFIEGGHEEKKPSVWIPSASAECSDAEIVFNSHLNVTLELSKRALSGDGLAFHQDVIRAAFREKAPDGLWMELALGDPGSGVEQWYE
jgi:hypothetical protein